MQIRAWEIVDAAVGGHVHDVIARATVWEMIATAPLSSHVMKTLFWHAAAVAVPSSLKSMMMAQKVGGVMMPAKVCEVMMNSVMMILGWRATTREPEPERDAVLTSECEVG